VKTKRALKYVLSTSLNVFTANQTTEVVVIVEVCAGMCGKDKIICSMSSRGGGGNTMVDWTAEEAELGLKASGNGKPSAFLLYYMLSTWIISRGR
jgi:hypothetical protein